MSPLDRPTLVIAANEESYRLWCRANGMSPYSKQVHYISGPEQLYGWGRVNIEIDSFPDWWELADSQQVALMEEFSNA